MQILRFPSITETQFLGCAAAFVDCLTRQLDGMQLNLKRLEGKNKGSAFSFEIQLDQNRYGCLIALERWAGFVKAFGPHASPSRYPAIAVETPARVGTAEEILARLNRLIDGAPRYSTDIIEASALSSQSVRSIFSEEERAATQMASLGPMLPEEYQEARGIFAGDLGRR